MDEEEKECFTELISSVRELKEVFKGTSKESVENLKLLKVPIVAKVLGKNPEDVRELMRRPDFPSVPDENGDLKVEEQKFIAWCRAEHINIK